MAASNQPTFQGKPFDWAEPLICEQVLQTYDQVQERTGIEIQRIDKQLRERIIAAHTRMWLALVAGDERTFSARRVELMRLAAEARIPSASIDRADRAVLLELVLVVVTRFRSSDRLRTGYVERLQAALRIIKANPSYTLH